jgi:hypothetical protein
MNRQGVRRDDVALLREGAQIDRSSLAQEEVDHSTASLADEMIVRAGLGIEARPLVIQEDGPDLALVDEPVKVAIHSGETDPREFLVNPLVDLMGEWVRVIALQSFEHLLQLARRTCAGGSPHRLTSTPRYRPDRIELLLGAIIKSTRSPVKGLPVARFPKRLRELRWAISLRRRLWCGVDRGYRRAASSDSQRFPKT